MESKKFFGYKAAIGAFLIIFVNLGALNTFGTFMNSMSQTTGDSLAAVGLVATFNPIGNILFSLLALPMVKKISAKWTLLIASLVGVLHFVMYSFYPVCGIWMLYLAGFLSGCTIACGTHAVCQSVISSWFVEKRESICGWAFSGAGIGAALWVFLAGQLFKVMEWTQCYRVMAVIMFVITVPSCLFLIRDPEKMGQKALGWEKAEELTRSSELEAARATGITYKAALKSPAFWVLALALIVSVFASCTFLSYTPTWWQMNGMSPTQAATWNSVYMLLAGVSAIVAGNVARKSGAKVFIIYVHIALAIAFILHLLFGMSGAVVIALLTCVAGALAYPVQTNIPAMVTQGIFGMKDFAKISASLMTAIYIGQMLPPIIIAVFLNGSSGLRGGWIFACCAAVLGMTLCLISVAISPLKRIKTEQ